MDWRSNEVESMLLLSNCGAEWTDGGSLFPKLAVQHPRSTKSALPSIGDAAVDPTQQPDHNEQQKVVRPRIR